MKFRFIPILFILIMGGIIFSGFYGINKKAYATRECNCSCIPDPIPTDWLPEWLELHLPKCQVSPTPTGVIPTPTTCRPTPTPTTEQEITPTPTTGGGEVTPTPTLEIIPTVTPTPTTTSGGQGGPGDGGGSNNAGGPYSCPDPAPSTPTLLSANKQSDGNVLLTWTRVSSVTHYGVSYGTSSKSYQFGQTDIGSGTSYTVGSLDKSQNYCFVVNAVNGCASSSFSNEVCTGSVLGASTGGQVLGLSTTSGDNMGIKLGTSIIGLLCLMFGIRLRKV